MMSRTRRFFFHQSRPVKLLDWRVGGRSEWGYRDRRGASVLEPGQPQHSGWPIFHAHRVSGRFRSLRRRNPISDGLEHTADLVITVLGSSITIPLNPSPNDVIFNDFGVKVTLNQQINDVEGGFGQGIIVNAIAVDLDILGVKGFIDIGQSKASISEAAVPEPSTWAMMALGFVGLAFAYRRARKVAAIG